MADLLERYEPPVAISPTEGQVPNSSCLSVGTGALTLSTLLSVPSPSYPRERHSNGPSRCAILAGHPVKSTSIGFPSGATPFNLTFQVSPHECSVSLHRQTPFHECRRSDLQLVMTGSRTAFALNGTRFFDFRSSSLSSDMPSFVSSITKRVSSRQSAARRAQRLVLSRWPTFPKPSPVSRCFRYPPRELPSSVRTDTILRLGRCPACLSRVR